MLYNPEDYNWLGGQIFHTYASFKFPRGKAALCAAINQGAMPTIATDEVCCRVGVKSWDRRIDHVTGGNSGSSTGYR